MYELQTAERRATDAMHSIVVEVANDENTRRAFEAVCFDRKFLYRKMYSRGTVWPNPGHIFYEIRYSDVRQLFWLGAAFQSQLNSGL